MKTRYTSVLFLFFLSTLLLLNDRAAGHEEHDKERSNQMQKSPQTSAGNQQQLATENAPKEARKPIPAPFSGSLKDHAHNKLVHFPLGFGIAGVVFVFFSLKKPEMITAVRILWFLAALAALGAYFTGEAQEEPFEEGTLHDVVELHENLGIATGISLAVGFLISLSRRLKALTTIWAVVVLVLLSVTGYYGGLLGHS